MLPRPLSLLGTTPAVIADGDLVIVYERHDKLKPVYVTCGEVYNNRFGSFVHDDWIGKPFGSKVLGRGGRGFVYILAPTPELWTLSLPHRTQILYIADISTVIHFMDLRPGSVVLESGTGSGSLTHSFIRACAPSGHVYTFEFHAQRAQAAWEELKRNGMSETVTVTIRDVEGEGFPEELAGLANGVFLDLPGPWKVVPSAAKSLMPNGVLCTFSPCIEQVQRACLAMADNGFHEIQTIEILLREYDVERPTLRPFGGPQPPPVKPDLRRKRGHGEIEGDDKSTEEVSDKNPSEVKQSAPSEDKATSETEGKIQATQHEDEVSIAGTKPETPHKADTPVAAVPKSIVAVRPRVEARGHTGYLTFARLAVAL